MNILFNKALVEQASTIFDLYLKPTHRSSETQIIIYSDAANSSATTTVAPQNLLFVNIGFIAIIDKISNAFWNESFDISSYGEKVKITINTILHGNETQRNSAFDSLISLGLLTSGDTTLSRAIVTGFKNYDISRMVKTYNTEKSCYDYTYNSPIELTKKYDKVRNTTNEKLFLLSVARGNGSFGYDCVTGETFGHLTKYWDTAFEKNSLAISYLAIDLSDTTSADTTAIKYDHLDTIEYFDNIVVQIAMTNQYN